MLKLFRGLVLAITLIVANAYVPPTYAASGNVVITHIQAGGSGAALQEIIVIYNNSPDEVDITGWCLRNKSQYSIACFVPSLPTEHYYLQGYGSATIGSIEFGYPDLDIAYIAANRSSGDIVGSSDTISLVDLSGDIVDSYSWTTGLAGGMIWARKLDTPMTYLDTDQNSDWELNRLQIIPSSGLMNHIVAEDLCWNIQGIQIEVPIGFTLKVTGGCVPVVAQLLITELLPNASGSDDGHEFIEIYNPNDHDVDLIDYVLKIGPSFEAKAGFPAGSNIAAHTYLSFSNADIHYILSNTTSRVQLAGTDGTVFDETPSYQDPADDMAWALIDGMWQYTDQPTPGAPNLSNRQLVTVKEVIETSSLQPCAANQYRSPETNRCRLIAVVAVPTPCKDGQYRSEETNRCRNIEVAAETTPCKEGQERNPETNRCRNVVAVTKADYAVLGTQTASGGNNWYIWAAIGGVLLVAIGYGVWEWRWELSKLWFKAMKFVRIRK